MSEPRLSLRDQAKYRAFDAHEDRFTDHYNAAMDALDERDCLTATRERLKAGDAMHRAEQVLRRMAWRTATVVRHFEKMFDDFLLLQKRVKRICKHINPAYFEHERGRRSR